MSKQSPEEALESMGAAAGVDVEDRPNQHLVARRKGRKPNQEPRKVVAGPPTPKAEEDGDLDKIVAVDAMTQQLLKASKAHVSIEAIDDYDEGEEAEKHVPDWMPTHIMVDGKEVEVLPDLLAKEQVMESTLFAKGIMVLVTADRFSKSNGGPIPDYAFQTDSIAHKGKLVWVLVPKAIKDKVDKRAIAVHNEAMYQMFVPAEEKRRRAREAVDHKSLDNVAPEHPGLVINRTSEAVAPEDFDSGEK